MGGTLPGRSPSVYAPAAAHHASPCPAAPIASPIGRQPGCKWLQGRGRKAAFGAAQAIRQDLVCLSQPSPPKKLVPTSKRCPRLSVTPVASFSHLSPLSYSGSLEPASFLGRPQLKLCLLPASVPFCDSLAGLQTPGDKTHLHP